MKQHLYLRKAARLAGWTLMAWAGLTILFTLILGVGISQALVTFVIGLPGLGLAMWGKSTPKNEST